MITTLLATLILAAPSTNIYDYVPTGFRDATFVAKVSSADFKELKKINDDFTQSYRFKQSQVWIKDPFMLKMVSTIEDTKITFLMNGGMRQTSIPRSKINLKENVSKKPGKHQTQFDFGMLSPSLFKGFFQAEFVRIDRATGDGVFDFTYPAILKDTSRHRVWIDLEKKMMTKREWYGQIKINDGRLMASMVYSNPKQENGIWVNQKVTVFNADNKQAGVIVYSGFDLNSGLKDEFFKI